MRWCQYGDKNWCETEYLSESFFLTLFAAFGVFVCYKDFWSVIGYSKWIRTATAADVTAAAIPITAVPVTAVTITAITITAITITAITITPVPALRCFVAMAIELAIICPT